MPNQSRSPWDSDADSPKCRTPKEPAPRRDDDEDPEGEDPDGDEFCAEDDYGRDFRDADRWNGDGPGSAL